MCGWREHGLSFWMKTYRCKTFPHSEMRDIRFPLEPGLIGCHPFEREDIDRQFQTWIWVASTFPQSKDGSCALYNIAEILSSIVQFACSATLFCCSLLHIVWRLQISHALVNLMNSVDIYFPSLSSWSSLIFALSWFSTVALNSLNKCFEGLAFPFEVAAR